MIGKAIVGRLSLILALLVVVLLLVVPAMAAGNQSANGGGTTSEIGERSTFTFNAVKHADGSVNGHLVYQFRGGDIRFQMAIDCLSISGNQAILGGVTTSVSGNTAGYPYIYVGARASFTVVDNGQGRAASPDMISDVIFSSAASCGTAYSTYLPISGNIEVKP